MASRPGSVLVTGAAGFVGRAVCSALASHGREVLRHARAGCIDGGAPDVCGDVTAIEDWRPCLRRVQGVVHLAALTHSGGLRASAAAARYHAVNVEATRRLAAQAAECGVARFVFMSSIKVNGERSPAEPGGPHAFSAADRPAPEDNYGRTKLAAEAALAEVFDGGVAAVTVLRPPLVYGPGQKGNLLRLMRLIDRGIPLPLGGIDNRRSLIFVDNLAGAVSRALETTTPGVHRYTVADVTLSTTALVQRLADAMMIEARLFAVPPAVWALLRRLPGLRGTAQRLTESLVVDAQAAHAELGWQPAVAPEAGFAATARWYRSTVR